VLLRGHSLQGAPAAAAAAAAPHLLFNSSSHLVFKLPEMSSTSASSTLIDIDAASDPKVEMIYCCRRCREPLFRPSMVTSHEVGSHNFTYHRTQKAAREMAGGGGGASAGSEDRGVCTSLFLGEALKWMASTASDIEGKLNCPKCGVRVGSLAWAGGQCSCGTWVTPAIQVQKKALDERYFARTEG
jgi:dual specificity phosphatase 12